MLILPLVKKEPDSPLSEKGAKKGAKSESLLYRRLIRQVRDTFVSVMKTVRMFHVSE